LKFLFKNSIENAFKKAKKLKKRELGNEKLKNQNDNLVISFQKIGYLFKWEVIINGESSKGRRGSWKGK
jgi:hypothetical protein